MDDHDSVVWIESEGRPKVLPVNHTVEETTVVFRTGFVERRVVEFRDPDELARTARLGPQPWAPGERDHWMRIIPATVGGRVISRRGASPGGTFLPCMPPD